MFFQAGEDLLVHGACTLTCIRPYKPFRLNLGQPTKEKGGTDS